MIQRPDANPYLPKKIYDSPLTKPKIELKIDSKSKHKGSDDLPTVDLHYSWYNVIRKFRLYFDRTV